MLSAPLNKTFPSFLFHDVTVTKHVICLLVLYCLGDVVMCCCWVGFVFLKKPTHKCTHTHTHAHAHAHTYIYIYIYLVKVANLAVECSMPYKQNVV